MDKFPEGFHGVPDPRPARAAAHQAMLMGKLRKAIVKKVASGIKKGTKDGRVSVVVPGDMTHAAVDQVMKEIPVNFGCGCAVRDIVVGCWPFSRSEDTERVLILHIYE